MGTVPPTLSPRLSEIRPARRTRRSASLPPEMIGEMVRAFGAERVTVAIDVAQNAAIPSGYDGRRVRFPE